MADVEVVHAYRHLYRGLLRAVQYSKPARYVGLHQLRTAFRERGAVFNQNGIDKTLQFLEAAAKSRGLEHKVLKNLLFVHFYRDFPRATWRQMQVGEKSLGKRTNFQKHVQATCFKNYDMTIGMLNKSMGTCLR